MPIRPCGVGFLGGGLATQAIHIPVLATLPHRFKIVRIMSPNPHVAAEVARRCDAKASTVEQDVLDDPAIEIVAICSPNASHARQVIAACEAGKKLVFCEKPLAVTRAEADHIGHVARATRTPIVVGTMHAYDPAYRAAHAAWTQAQEQASFVQSTIFLSSNDVFIDQATDRFQSSPIGTATTPEKAPAAFQPSMEDAIKGLAIHAIPLLRGLYPSVDAVVSSQLLRPFGYSLAMISSDAQAELLALMPGTWSPDWRFRALGRRHELSAAFPPSYVLAGSARVTLSSPERTIIFEESVNGYQAMWSNIGDVARGEAAPLVTLETALDDFAFAMDIVDLSNKISEARE
jgi:hypothetical protein